VAVCVKYGNLEALNMLIEAGADPLLHDCYDKNLLWNALERSDPAIVARLLELGVDAKEQSITDSPWSDSAASLTSFMMIGADYRNIIPWKVYGPPDKMDFVRCFLMLLDHGCELQLHPALLQRTEVMVSNMQIDSIKLAPDNREQARTAWHPTHILAMPECL